MNLATFSSMRRNSTHFVHVFLTFTPNKLQSEYIYIYIYILILIISELIMVI
jgi:hypothetical protein